MPVRGSPASVVQSSSITYVMSNRALGGNAEEDDGKDVRANNGIKGSTDVFFEEPSSTLAAEFAEVGYRCREFEDSDMADVRRLFVENMGPYSEKWDKSSKFYEFWWSYMNKALDEGDLKDAAELRRVYTESGGCFFVLEDVRTGTAVGTVGFEKLVEPVGTGELRRMNVSAHARRAGLGQKLVRRVEEFAAVNGFSQVVLTTGSVMLPAMQFYKRAGFEHWREGYLPPEMVEDFRSAPTQGEPDVALFYEAAFRKPVTGNQGRWIWNPHVDGGPTGVSPSTGTGSGSGMVARTAAAEAGDGWLRLRGGASMAVLAAAAAVAFCCGVRVTFTVKAR